MCLSRQNGGGDAASLSAVEPLAPDKDAEWVGPESGLRPLSNAEEVDRWTEFDNGNKNNTQVNKLVHHCPFQKMFIIEIYYSIMLTIQRKAHLCLN